MSPTVQSTVTALKFPNNKVASDNALIGYMTIADFWGKYEPASLAMLEDPISVFLDDEKALKRVCQSRGIEFFSVKADDALQRRGVSEQAVFPAAIVSEFYPINP
jgi:hypothetical protein